MSVGFPQSIDQHIGVSDCKTRSVYLHIVNCMKDFLFEWRAIFYYNGCTICTIMWCQKTYVIFNATTLLLSSLSRFSNIQRSHNSCSSAHWENVLNIPSKGLFRNEILSLGEQLCCVLASFHWIVHVIKVLQLECFLDNGQGLHLITSNSESEHHQFCLWAIQFFKTNLPTFCPGQFPQLNSPVSHLKPHSSVHFSFHFCAYKVL